MRTSQYEQVMIALSAREAFLRVPDY
jgi:hypothetical protein